MTDNSDSADGRTDSTQVGRADDACEPTREELAAANEHLRERIDDLEAALAEVQAMLAAESADTAENSPAATGDTDASEDGTAADPQLVTSGGQPTKVIGKLGDDQGIGVRGEATASSTVTYGVEGISQSWDVDAAGVRASASNGAKGLIAEADGNRGIEVSVTNDDAIYAETDDSAAVFGYNTATSGRAWGVRGDTMSTDINGYGVRGEALAGGSSKGVAGLTYGEDDGAAGVYGKSRGTSGFVHGVKGETDSSDGYGLYTPDDASVEGSMSVGKVGISAYLDGDQTIDHSTLTRVVFNNMVVDHFNGMDTSTGIYTIPEAGHYHVSFTINWSDKFDSGVPVTHRLEINDTPLAQGLNSVQRTAGNSRDPERNYSRTVFDLSSGDTVQVVVNQESGSSKDIFGSNQETYLTIHKVG